MYWSRRYLSIETEMYCSHQYLSIELKCIGLVNTYRLILKCIGLVNTYRLMKRSLPRPLLNLPPVGGAFSSRFAIAYLHFPGAF